MNKKIKKYWWIIIPILIIVGILAVSKEPQFFDSFGIMVFAYLTISSLYLLKKRYNIFNLINLIIGVIGLTVDLLIVLRLG